MTNQSPYRLADPLGSAVSEHPVHGVQQGVRIALGLFCLVIAGDCVYLGMWPRFGTIHWGGFVVTAIIALVFSWLSWDAFAEYIKAGRQRVVCHENGLRIHNSNGHSDLRFDDITSIGGVLEEAGKGTVPSGAVLWIDDVQGRRIALPSPHAQPHELGEIIRSRTFEKRHSTAQALLSRGEDVRFGRVVLASFALSIDGEVWPRSTLESAKLFRRWLSLAPHKGKTQLLPSEEIPNLDVLLVLLSVDPATP